MINLGNITAENLVVGDQWLMKAIVGEDVVWQREYIADGLVQHYDALNNTGSGYDSNATVWKDLVGNNDGTLQLGVNWDTNRLDFNNGRVRFNGNITNEFTIMGTILLKKQGIHPRWFGDPRYACVYFHTNAGVNNPYAIAYFSNTDGTIPAFDDVFNTRNTAVIPPENEVFHIAVRRGSTKIVELFINGIKVGETTRAVPDVANVTNAYLGGNSGTTRFFTGSQYSNMIYNKPLTDTEIMNNFIVDRTKYLS